MPPANLPRALIEIAYAEYARKYLESLPLEHFMEATAQATQREITLESLALVQGRRPQVQVFNELLVQYPRPGHKKPGQIVPDNMVIVCEKPIKADGSYDVILQPAAPFWVLEYVSKHSKRKDYEESSQKYERDLKTPYYLLFYPDNRELTLYHLKGRKYASVKPNARDRYTLPELALEMAILDGWVRYWYEGELLPLPAEMQRDLDAARRQIEEQRRRAEKAEQRFEQEHEGRLALERELEQLRRQLRQKPGKS
jgi:Uma2 family endonuclease